MSWCILRMRSEMLLLDGNIIREYGEGECGDGGPSDNLGLDIKMKTDYR